MGGDHTVRKNGYLLMDITKYTSLVQSIIVPVAMLLLGGIGLPGGAVFVRHDLLRNRVWESAVSAAGPLSGLLVALIFSRPFHYISERDIFTGPHQLFYYALGFASFFMVTSTLINLIPLPPLDGFGVVEPWLPAPIKEWLNRPNVMNILSIVSTLSIFLLFWQIPGVTNFISGITLQMGVPKWVVGQGLKNFKFLT